MPFARIRQADSDRGALKRRFLDAQQRADSLRAAPGRREDRFFLLGTCSVALRRMDQLGASLEGAVSTMIRRSESGARRTKKLAGSVDVLNLTGGFGAVVWSSSLMKRDDIRRCQAENPLIGPSGCTKPALSGTCQV